MVVFHILLRTTRQNCNVHFKQAKHIGIHSVQFRWNSQTTMADTDILFMMETEEMGMIVNDTAVQNETILSNYRSTNGL